jgi:hypothetical protein
MQRPAIGFSALVFTVSKDRAGALEWRRNVSKRRLLKRGSAS